MNISELKGVGPKKVAALQKKDIFTAEDLVRTFPVDYEDRRQITPMAELEVGRPALVKGRVLAIKNDHFNRRRKRVLRVTLQDVCTGDIGLGALEVVFFNSAYLSQAFRVGVDFFFYGKPVLGRGRIQMIHPEFTPAEGDQALQLLPVYPTVRGVGQREIRKFVDQVLDMPALLQEISTEYLPDWYRTKYDLLPLSKALWSIHQPEDFQDIRLAKRRFLYEEMFLLHLGMMRMRRPKRPGMAMDQGDTASYIASLPFPLTGAQQRTVDQVVADMERPQPMNRLIQGDVGSGKTVIAEIALVKAAQNGYQSAYMMPTELLARQQFEHLSERFGQMGIRMGLLVGSLPAAEKSKLLTRMEKGEVDVVVGTHALIQKSVTFRNLGLVITDEQHRFGVRQRSAIKEKGTEPDCLVMSATPIPRTLAMILFGDMDISVIDELPAKRLPIKTKVLTGKRRKQIYDFVDEEIQKGRQAYVVAPLIEESDKMEGVRSATELHEKLAQRFSHRQIALLHGDLSTQEKAEIMEAFEKGEIDLLVSTVVIEVGINVPNATVMVIESCERFGLAQLHQLRGRVGRGAEQSYCVLVTGDLSQTALARARIMMESTDGFYIAEKDLELRGPGELFGARQHGVPAEYIFQLINNPSIYEQVRPDAEQFFKEHPDLAGEECEGLRHQITRIFGRDVTPTL